MRCVDGVEVDEGAELLISAQVREAIAAMFPEAPDTVVAATLPAPGIRWPWQAPATPAAALEYVRLAQPPAACEYSADARAAWAAVIKALSRSSSRSSGGGGGSGSGTGGGGGGSGDFGQPRGVVELRASALRQLADTLPPPSFFAVLASAEASLAPAESDALRQRSLAGEAARSLRAVVAELAAEEAADAERESLAEYNT